MITQEIYNKITRLINLNRFTSSDAKEMEDIIRKNINHQYSVCTSCKGQIAHGQRVMGNWLRNKTIIEESLIDLEITPLFQINPEVSVDIVEADKVGCVKCGKRSKKNKG